MVAVSLDRKSTRLNSSHTLISYAVFCLKKKKKFIRIKMCSGVSYLLFSITHSNTRAPTCFVNQLPLPSQPPYSYFSSFFFFFNDTATTEIYTLSLHDALPISDRRPRPQRLPQEHRRPARRGGRSEEHTSELQSHSHLVCRLLLEKKTERTAEDVLPVDPDHPGKRHRVQSTI